MFQKMRASDQFLIVGLTCSLLLACTGSDDPCYNTIARREEAPASDAVAVVYQRNCGATTGISLHVSILGLTDSLPNDPGNAVRAAEPPGARLYPSPQALTLRWQPDLLLIKYDSTSVDVYFSDTVVNDIRIVLVPDSTNTVGPQ
jgi:hypothetical protein